MAARVAFVANTNILELLELKDSVNDTFINDATVTAVLVDLAGVEIAGQSWPVTLAFVLGSNGDYRATISELVKLIKDTEFIFKITATKAGVGVGFWKFRFVAETRVT